MSGHWITGQGRDRNPAPFEVHFSTGVPSAGVGQNGDFAFCYGNDGLALFKKIEGTWRNTATGAYFAGFNSGNSQVLTMTTPFTEVVVTSYDFTDDHRLEVQVDGITQYDGDGFTRNSSLSKIIFPETIEASTDNPVHVFVGKYEGTGFTGFHGGNSELFEVTSNTVDVDITNFVITDYSLLRVEVDGIGQSEGASLAWTRDVANNRVSFTETIVANPSSPVKIFVGKYN
jgi:hypothetical protein